MSTYPSGKGLLWAESEPGQVTLNDYEQWLDVEHIPLRMDTFPEFQSGARYSAFHIPGGDPEPPNPSWSAIFELSDLDIFSQDRYTSIRLKRTPHESTVLKTLAALDRYTGTLISDTGTTGESAPYLLVVATTPEIGKEEELNNWYKEEHYGIVSKAPGFRRLHRYEIVDTVQGGAGKESVTNGPNAPKYIAIWEWDSLEFLSSPHTAEAMKTPRAVEVQSYTKFKIGVWKLHKAFEAKAAKAAA